MSAPTTITPRTSWCTCLRQKLKKYSPRRACFSSAQRESSLRQVGAFRWIFSCTMIPHFWICYDNMNIKSFSVGTEIVPGNPAEQAANSDNNFGVPMRSSWGKQLYWLCRRSYRIWHPGRDVIHPIVVHNYRCIFLLSIRKFCSLHSSASILISAERFWT